MVIFNLARRRGRGVREVGVPEGLEFPPAQTGTSGDALVSGAEFKPDKAFPASYGGDSVRSCVLKEERANPRLHSFSFQPDEKASGGRGPTCVLSRRRGLRATGSQQRKNRTHGKQGGGKKAWGVAID